MSFAKYAQLYRENGFFNGSKIKTTITDPDFVGQEMILSKGTTILQTRTIPISMVTEFFTDESGTLTLSADNGTKIISATVSVSNYRTYNVTVSATATDTSRDAYAKDVEMTADPTEAYVAYTGNVSTMTVAVSDPNLVNATVDGNKIILTDAGNDKQGRCTITATIAKKSTYDSAEVTFNVNKLTGQYGSWQDASDEVIANMIAKADAGEIDLADYWDIGDTRRVHLNAIQSGAEVAGQDEQDIDLVIMHNPLGDSKYMLTTPTAGNRYQPNFIIGVKDCLLNKSAMGYFEKTIEARDSQYSSANVSTNTSFVSIDAMDTAELLELLNDDFILALPEYIQNALKATNRLYVCAGGEQSERAYMGYGYLSYTTSSRKSHRVSLANIKELGLESAVVRGDSSNGYRPKGTGIYNDSGSINSSGSHDDNYAVNITNDNVNACGTKFAYYNNRSLAKKKGINGAVIDYLVPDSFMAAYVYNGSSYRTKWSTAFYIDSSGTLATNNLTDSGQRTMLRGVSPIMFI